MPSELLLEQKQKIINRIEGERAYIQPELISALALIEILERLENEKDQNLR
jgi:hypothetical protein